MAAAVWQQALALDARYNAYRAPSHPQFSEYLFKSDCHILQSITYATKWDLSMLFAGRGVVR